MTFHPKKPEQPGWLKVLNEDPLYMHALSMVGDGPEKQKMKEVVESFVQSMVDTLGQSIASVVTDDGGSEIYTKDDVTVVNEAGQVINGIDPPQPVVRADEE